MGRLAGTLKRVGTGTKLPVLVNDVRIDLPVIHARGRLGEEDAEFYFLEDAQNPMNQSLHVGGQSAQVVKISFPIETKPAPTATALAEIGRAEVYGIYFDFASATLKPESEPALREIADAMTKNPSWMVSIEGHTDNIGGDSYNLDLSRRRAAAVKEALSGSYRIAPNRLATTGFGAARPKEANDALAGRARNRRVELVRK
jgi:outer membrane protein OmpA-like peptidoglycan-associated protein